MFTEHFFNFFGQARCGLFRKSGDPQIANTVKHFGAYRADFNRVAFEANVKWVFCAAFNCDGNA